MQTPGLCDCISGGLLTKHGLTLLLHAAHSDAAFGTCTSRFGILLLHFAVQCPRSHFEPTFIAFATMSKSPFSADYIHKMLKTLSESEKGKFMEMLVEQPVADQLPASRSGGSQGISFAALTTRCNATDAAGVL